MSQPRITEILEKSFDSNAGTFAVQAANASLPTTFTEYNVVLTLADTEDSQALPSGTKSLEVSVQDGDVANNFRLSFTTGKVATPTAPFQKFFANEGWSKENVNLTGATLYLAGSNAGDIVQIIAWT